MTTKSYFQILGKSGDSCKMEDETFEEIKPFNFYTEDEIKKLTFDIGLAQKRTNKLMQLSRLNSAIKVIIRKMGFETESSLKNAERKGHIIESSLYDAYLLAKYERDAVSKRLSELPNVPKIASLFHLFFYEVQNADPEFCKEMKERAGARVAKINSLFIKTENGE